jgi:hypothetical protein
MHFNTKYIFQGDSQRDITNKINYNFDQILSFAVGPDGHIGPRGATGLYGPAGYKGASGATGTRASKIFKQPTQPLASETQEYDVWVDNSSGEGDVNVLGATGNWSYSGYSFFTSSYFSTFSWMLGPAGSTDKYVIGIKDTVNSPEINLVLSDGDPDPSYSNPNKSKLLVATQDQTTTPIMSFGKSGAISQGVPSFYWDSSGSNSNLSYRSSGDLDITSQLRLGIDSALARTLLFGNNLNLTAANFTIGGSGDFQLASNTTVGSGGVFNVSSTNLLFSSSYFTHFDPTTIYASSGNYVLNDVPNSAGLNSGITVATTASANDTFSINDLTGYPVLSGKPYGTVDSGKHSEIIFGSTGGVTGGTAGPFSYHVKKASQVTKSTISVSSVSTSTTSTTSTVSLPNVFDLTQTSLWDANVIVVTPTAVQTSAVGIYLRIPSSYLNTLDPVYSTGKTNIYRILLNSLNPILYTSYIQGFVYTYTNYGSGGLTSTSILTYVDLPTPITTNRYCQYVDLHWLGVANATNLNPRLFYKACNGVGGYIELTNLNSIGSEQPITSGSSPAGGGSYGGEFEELPPTSGSSCPTPDMLILLGQDKWISAGELEVGMEVYTEHEYTNEWGYYRVSHVGRAVQSVISAMIGGKSIKVSESHRFLTTDGEYIAIAELPIGTTLRTVEGTAILESKENIGNMEVVKIEVDDAHTYVLEEVLSHNIKYYIDPGYNIP